MWLGYAIIGQYKDLDFFIEFINNVDFISDEEKLLNEAIKTSKNIARFFGGTLKLKYDFKSIKKENHETNT
jgi:hypothetical protein